MNTKDSETHTRAGAHPLIPNQYRRGGSSIKRFRGCGLMVGRKWFILEFLPRLFLGEMPCWDDISPKRGK